VFSQITHIFTRFQQYAFQHTRPRAEEPLVAKTSKPIDNVESVIWTVRDVAEYLRISEAKVYRLVKEQRLPVVRIGKTWRFRKDLLDEWLHQCAESSMRKDGDSRPAN
jgi:excisionase family DNA binding protein